MLNISFVLNTSSVKKQIIHVWNKMMAIKLWQNFPFWVNHPIKMINNRCLIMLDSTVHGFWPLYTHSHWPCKSIMLLKKKKKINLFCRFHVKKFSKTNSSEVVSHYIWKKKSLKIELSVDFKNFEGPPGIIFPASVRFLAHS